MSLPVITLYSWYYSDCSTRLRIALNYKQLPYKVIEVHVKDVQDSSQLKQLNPSQTIPTLVLEYEDGQRTVLTQSLAALEYLEELRLPEARIHSRLMPTPEDIEARATVRTLMQIIATDIHPLTTPRITEAVHASTGSDKYDWSRSWITRGLTSYEKSLEGSGRYSVGEEPTLADVLLMPQLRTARSYGIDLTSFPKIQAIYTQLMKLSSFGDELQERKSS